MIAGLSSTLPSTMFAGLTAHGVSATVAHQVANLPPVGSLFAAFLGYNPMTTLLGPSLHTLSASQAAYLSGQTFFPNLISNPFIVGHAHHLRVLGDHDAGRCDGLLAAGREPGAAGGGAARGCSDGGAEPAGQLVLLLVGAGRRLFQRPSCGVERRDGPCRIRERGRIMLGGSERQFEPDGDAVGVALRTDLAAMGRDQLLDDRETDAGTTASTCSAGISAEEALEYVRERVIVDGLADIVDRDTHRPARAGRDSRSIAVPALAHRIALSTMLPTT